MYYHIDDPLLDEKEGLDFETSMLKKLRPNGLMDSSDENLTAIDRDFAEADFSESLVANVKKKKDGDFAASAQVLSKERFALLSDFVKDKVLTTGCEILNGEISVAPYKRENKTGCDYCPYHSICGFEPTLDGFMYHRMNKKFTEDEFFEEISGE